MTALATVDTFAAQLDEGAIERAIAEVHDLGAGEAADRFTKAETIKRLLGTRNATEEMRSRLGRLECWLVWRLAQLGAMDDLPMGHIRSAAYMFRQYDEAAFTDLLAQYGPGGPVAIYRRVGGTTSNPPRYPWRGEDDAPKSMADLRYSVSRFLGELLRGEVENYESYEGGPLTTEMAWHAWADSGHDPSVEAEIAFKDAARRLFQQDQEEGLGCLGLPLPQFVVFRQGADGDSDWVYQPIRNATLAELRWMAQHRADQAAVIARRAADLAEWVTYFEKAGASDGARLGEFIPEELDEELDSVAQVGTGGAQ